MKNLTRSAFYRARIKLSGHISDINLEEILRNSLNEEGYDLKSFANVSVNPFNLDSIMSIMAAPDVYLKVKKDAAAFHEIAHAMDLYNRIEEYEVGEFAITSQIVAPELRIVAPREKGALITELGEQETEHSLSKRLEKAASNLSTVNYQGKTRTVIKCEDLTYAEMLAREMSRVAAGIAAGIVKRIGPYLDPFAEALKGNKPDFKYH